MPAGVPSGSSADLKRGAGALKRLKKRIDGVIKELDESPGAQHKVAAARKMTRRSLSGDNLEFLEADGLFQKYNEVHDTLTALSKALREQIDGIGIAVKIADHGFDSLEEDEKRRYERIQARADELMRGVDPKAEPKDSPKGEGKGESKAGNDGDRGGL
ncbi:hypothetical protein [Streptomyces sp. NPDC048172]|uniref:hypothetical protein n=1 Tax=Streptomyces sp. NPDC048172 TaxID=3365505 RepID=UPI0037115382